MIPGNDKLAELRSIGEAYGTPAYVYDARVVASRISAIRSVLCGIPIRLLYALKANALPALLRVIHEYEIGVDVVSPGELHLALAIGFTDRNVLFSANNMTDDEMVLAQSSGVLINFGEITRLEKFGSRFPGSEVSLRINPQYGAGHHEHVVTAGERSKFGIPLDDLARARQAAVTHGLSIVGLHQHIGSGNLSLEPYRKAVPVLFDTARQFRDIEFVNIGGGFGVAYRPEESAFNLASLAALLADESERFRRDDGRSLEIWMEPGRYLAAEAGVLLIQVNTIKESFGQIFVGTDSGMSHLVRPAIYGAYHGVVNVSNPDGPERIYNVVGNICESSDFFAHERRISEIREGDFLAVLDAGAYGRSMASEYNLRPLPREVFVDEAGRAELVREAETPEQLAGRVLAGK